MTTMLRRSDNGGAELVPALSRDSSVGAGLVPALFGLVPALPRATTRVAPTGADRVEVHEPRLEERPRHRLQRLVHSPVEFDLVIQRAEDMGDGALFGRRRDINRDRMNEVAV